MFRITRGLIATVAALGIVVGTPGCVSAASINILPGTVVPGDSVRLSGDILIDGVPWCDVTGTVTLISEAFAGLDEFAGVASLGVRRCHHQNCLC